MVTDPRQKLPMEDKLNRTIGDRLKAQAANSNDNDGTEETQRTSFDAASKFKRLTEEIEHITDAKITPQEDHFSFRLESGREVRCELANGIDLLITTTITSIRSEYTNRCSSQLLKLNAFGKATSGGWLALSPQEDVILFHYVWNEFSICTAELFLTLIAVILQESERLETVVKEIQTSARY